MPADFKSFLDIVQAVCSLGVFPLLVILFRLYDKIVKLELAMTKEYATKRQVEALEWRVDRHASRIKANFDRLEEAETG